MVFVNRRCKMSPAGRNTPSASQKLSPAARNCSNIVKCERKCNRQAMPHVGHAVKICAKSRLAHFGPFCRALFAFFTTVALVPDGRFPTYKTSRSS